MSEDQLGQEATPPNPEDGLVSITNLDQFVQFLTAWHIEKSALTKHMLDIPDGTEFKVGDEPRIMTGDTLAGFKLGIEVALMHLGTLPFVAEVEDTAPEPVSA